MGLSRAIREEKNPEILVQLLEHCHEHIDRIEKENQIFRSEKDLAEQNSIALDDKLCVLQKRMFGKSSEKSSSTDRAKSDESKTIHTESVAPAPSVEEQQKLHELTVDEKLTDVELKKIALEYGYPEDSEWEQIEGFYDESDFVDVVVQSYVRKKVKRFKYRLKASVGSEKEVIVTAPTALKIMEGSKYGVDLSVDVAVKKYLYHLPLNRIQSMMLSGGLTVAVNTLYSLCAFVSFYLEEICKDIKLEIMACGLCLHLDETPWPINTSKQDDGYMWVMSNAAGSFYQFEPTRSGDIAKELVGSYQGPILSDGFSGYKRHFKKSDKVVMSYCWAHAKRKFTDIEKNYPKECKQIKKLISGLSKVEHKAKSYDHLQELREKESKKIIETIQIWLMETKKKARPESHLEKAVNYSMNHWEGLTKFLKDAKIPLTNNEAERAIRQSVMGRKNFYGSRSINGADVASTMYTVIESCKKVELDPKSYILMVVKLKAKDKTAKVPTPLQYARQIRSATTA